MKCKVIHNFRDKDNFSIIYKVGEMVDFEDARAESLANRKLVVVVEEKKEEDVPQAQTLFPQEEHEHVAEVEAEKHENPAEAKEEAQDFDNEDANVEADEGGAEPSAEEEPNVEESLEETIAEDKPKRGRRKNA